MAQDHEQSRLEHAWHRVQGPAQGKSLLRDGHRARIEHVPGRACLIAHGKGRHVDILRLDEICPRGRRLTSAEDRVAQPDMGQRQVDPRPGRYTMIGRG